MKKFILIIILVGYGNVFNLWSIQNYSPVKCKNKPLICENNWEEAKRYYREEGEWSRVFIMEPVRAKLSGPACHILYNYTPASNSYRTDSGIDYRIFYFSQETKTCKWKVYRMGDYHSGYLAL